jgi:hypothetical protein
MAIGDDIFIADTVGSQPMLDLSDAAHWLLANGEPVPPTAAIEPPRKRPRPLFVFPAKYAKLLQACRCVCAR